ncbi:MAG TPA: Zn-ribbon domain-containing OB-fold protein [Candidatus Acidoferrales bacterium]|nr:Zn-ribbon domain-containing OB-fold protein [Candidatus Acidoferrales bacterium]
MAYVSIPTYSRSIPQRYALIAAKCKSCGTVNFPTTLTCLKCEKTEFEPLKLSGKGKIYCYTTISRGGSPPEFSAQQNLVGSYQVAVVELDEGPKVVVQMTNCKPEDLKIGLPVEATFRRIYEDDGILRYGIKFMLLRSG